LHVQINVEPTSIYGTETKRVVLKAIEIIIDTFWPIFFTKIRKHLLLLTGKLGQKSRDANA